MKTLSFAAILVTMCAVAACSDDGGSGGEGGAGGGGGATSTSTSTSASSTVTTTGTGTGGAGGSGAGGGDTGGGGTGGGADCTTQCFEDNQEGALAFIQLTLDACGCAEGASCTSICDTTDPETDVCSDDGTGDFLAAQGNEACITCIDELEDEDACIAVVEEGCDADEGCTAFATCVAACP
ncbi:hypothetical protein [Sorangium sp. So ce1099]|uniref:hypothetical protein n=1 Tax=Sorangium sp. So ce1099 TaxID=3133331 RepID=UPI003F5D9AB4